MQRGGFIESGATRGSKVSSRRCPNCGGLVAEDAAWCGQCLTRLDEQETDPEEPARPARLEAEQAMARSATRATTSSADGRFRAAGDELVWLCPECDQANPLEETLCTRCGTQFRSLFEANDAQPSVDPRRAAALSLMFPGLGHRLLGRGVEGLARAVVFAWTLGAGVAILVMRGGFNAGPFLPLLLVLFAAAAVVYGVTVADAMRTARGDAPIMTSRMLLYGSTGLIIVIVVTLVIFGLRAAPN
jgi:hypothetical protein